MKIVVPDSILSIDPYVPGKPIETLERELGIEESIKLASNENPIGPSPLAIKALYNCMENLNRYPDGGGYDLVKKLSDHLNLPVEKIVLGAGSDDIIGMLTRALLTPGDEAVMPKPSFLMYDIMVRSCGAKSVYIPLNSLCIDLKKMAASVTEKTRLLFLTNPNNPTGKHIDRMAFEKFLDSIPDSVVVVVDEAYIEFVKDKTCAQSIQYINENRPLVTLRTFSKAYGLAGLRVGYGVMPETIAGLLHRVRQPFNVNALAQAAAIAALDDREFLKKTLETVHHGLDFLSGQLNRMHIRHFSSQANFLLIDLEEDADDVYRRLLKKGVIVRSMRSYGFPQYIRVTVGLPRENERFVGALETVLEMTEKGKGQIANDE